MSEVWIYPQDQFSTDNRFTGHPHRPLIREILSFRTKNKHALPLGKNVDQELERDMADLCASYQYAVVDALLRKTRQAVRKFGPFNRLALSRGVANNGVLREGFVDLGRRLQLPVFVAERRHTGDNAGMIAFASWIDRKGCFDESVAPLSFQPALRLGETSGVAG